MRYPSQGVGLTTTHLVEEVNSVHCQPFILILLGRKRHCFANVTGTERFLAVDVEVVT